MLDRFNEKLKSLTMAVMDWKSGSAREFVTKLDQQYEISGKLYLQANTDQDHMSFIKSCNMPPSTLESVTHIQML